AGREDDKPCGNLAAVIESDRPGLARLIKPRRVNGGVELDVLTQVQLVRDMPGVFQDFGLRRITLAPIPGLLQLVIERIRVLHTLDVTACPRVSVPIPGA